MKSIRINQKGYQWCLDICFAVSFAFLAFYQIIDYQKRDVILTFLLSFAITFYFLYKTGAENLGYMRKHVKISAVLFLASLVLVKGMHGMKGAANIDLVLFPSLPFRLFRFRWWLLSVPALFYLLVWVWRKAVPFLAEIWNGLTPAEKRAYFVITAISSAVVLVCYLQNPQWYMRNDAVYSIDSKWCYRGIFPDAGYYDIRHPVLGIFTFPIWAIIRFILQFFVPAHLLDPICVSCVQICNIQMLLLIAVIIGNLSASKWVRLLYLVSAPTLLFSLFLEKYQICTFLLVLYAYQICRKKDGNANLAIAVGAMATSAFIVLGEPFIREPVRAKLARWGRLILFGVAYLICTGRISLLDVGTVFTEISTKTQSYGLKGLPLDKSLLSLVNMIHGSFLSLDSAVDKAYSWTGIIEKCSLIGVVIVAFIIFGALINWKDVFVKVCVAWLAGAFLLFCVFQWSAHYSPLFSIYFSWALIPLFQKGLQFAIDKFHWREKIIYPAILVPMFVVNVLNMVSIGTYMA